MVDQVDQLRHAEVHRLLRKGRHGVTAAWELLQGLDERGALHDRQLTAMRSALEYVYRGEKARERGGANGRVTSERRSQKPPRTRQSTSVTHTGVTLV